MPLSPRLAKNVERRRVNIMRACSCSKKLYRRPNMIALLVRISLRFHLFWGGIFQQLFSSCLGHFFSRIFFINFSSLLFCPWYDFIRAFFGCNFSLLYRPCMVRFPRYLFIKFYTLPLLSSFFLLLYFNIFFLFFRVDVIFLFFSLSFLLYSSSSMFFFFAFQNLNKEAMRVMLEAKRHASSDDGVETGSSLPSDTHFTTHGCPQLLASCVGASSQDNSDEVLIVIPHPVLYY